MPPPSHTDTLRRVKAILELTCEQDGQGYNLQEVQRRKAYRKGINEALEQIDRALKMGARGRTKAAV